MARRTPPRKVTPFPLWNSIGARWSSASPMLLCAAVATDRLVAGHERERWAAAATYRAPGWVIKSSHPRAQSAAARYNRHTRLQYPRAFNAELRGFERLGATLSGCDKVR